MARFLCTRAENRGEIEADSPVEPPFPHGAGSGAFLFASQCANMSHMSDSNYKVVVVRGVFCAEWRENDGRRRRASLGTKDADEVTRRIRALDSRLQAARRPA